MGKAVTSFRDAIKLARERNELIETDQPVDPICEIVAAQKALDGSHALLFNNIKGYPGVRYLGNLFSSEARTAALLGDSEFKNLKFRFAEAARNPVPSIMTSEAPCQEVVLTADLDVNRTMPVLKHSAKDGARVLGGGVMFVAGLPGSLGNDISFKRANFRGGNWGVLHYLPATHLDYIHNVEHKGEKIPLTINIGVPPAVVLAAAGFTIKAVAPNGMDELGMAGAVQGAPVTICKARTVDGYAIASSEWVIEGYLTPERVWETEEAEKLGKARKAPFFPEWHGYMGPAGFDRKYEVTAITHRQDPIYTSYLPPSYEAENIVHPLTEACFYELAKSFAPGMVLDVNMLHGFRQLGGIVVKVRKTSSWDEGSVRNILLSALALPRYAIAIAVDEDVDIYNADEVLWAIWTRANHEGAIFRGMSDALIPGVLGATPATAMAFKRGGVSDGGLAIDATLPLSIREEYQRARYDVDKIDLSRLFSARDLESAIRHQSEYARSLAKSGG